MGWVREAQEKRPRSIEVREEEEVPGNTGALVVLMAGIDEVPSGTGARRKEEPGSTATWDVRRTEELVLGMAQEAWRTGNCWIRSCKMFYCLVLFVEFY